MKRLLATLVLLATTASASSAAGSFLSLQITSGTANLAGTVQTGTTDYTSAFDVSEFGLKGEYWHMLSSDYGFTVATGIGLNREVDQPGTSAPTGAQDQKFTVSSWSVRVGGDRVIALGERSYIYFGPGIEYWSGSAKFEAPPAATIETEKTTRISLSGRIGAHMMIGESWGLTLQAGHKVGYASEEEFGGKATWWPSSTDGSCGLVFRFGGK